MTISLELATVVFSILAFAVGYGSLRSNVKTHDDELKRLAAQMEATKIIVNGLEVTLARIEEKVTDIRNNCVACKKEKA